MEISGSVLRRVPISSGAGIRRDAGDPGSFSGLSITGRRVSDECGRSRFRVSVNPKKFLGVRCGGFSDEGHLKYYEAAARCGGKKKEEKKKSKLVKGLSKDLSAMFSIGFGVEAGEGLVGEVKGKMISDAAEVLLAQLNQLRAEEKEMKRKRKEEKAVKKAARMKDCEDSSSSSSSSESSDSDCETVVKMSTLRTGALAEPKHDNTLAIPTKPNDCIPDQLQIKPAERIEENHITFKPEPECSLVVATHTDKIEVCMGGKCKKSGALELLEEFERKVGIEGAVVGCKCMGKCRDGPNVRVMNQCAVAVNSVKVPSKGSLCLGVGFEDVGAIVANIFGEKTDVGILAA